MRIPAGALIEFQMGVGRRDLDVPVSRPALLPRARLLMVMAFGYSAVGVAPEPKPLWPPTAQAGSLAARSSRPDDFFKGDHRACIRL